MSLYTNFPKFTFRHKVHGLVLIQENQMLSRGQLPHFKPMKITNFVLFWMERKYWDSLFEEECQNLGKGVTYSMTIHALGYHIMCNWDYSTNPDENNLRYLPLSKKQLCLLNIPSIYIHKNLVPHTTIFVKYKIQYILEEI